MKIANHSDIDAYIYYEFGNGTGSCRQINKGVTYQICSEKVEWDLTSLRAKKVSGKDVYLSRKKYQFIRINCSLYVFINAKAEFGLGGKGEYNNIQRRKDYVYTIMYKIEEYDKKMGASLPIDIELKKILDNTYEYLKKYCAEQRENQGKLFRLQPTKRQAQTGADQ